MYSNAKSYKIGQNLVCENDIRALSLKPIVSYYLAMPFIIQFLPPPPPLPQHNLVHNVSVITVPQFNIVWRKGAKFGKRFKSVRIDLYDCGFKSYRGRGLRIKLNGNFNKGGSPLHPIHYSTDGTGRQFDIQFPPSFGFASG